MPLQPCSENGKPGFKWGAGGACYTYTPGNTASMAAAKRKAMAQAVAMSYSQKRAGKTPEVPV